MVCSIWILESELVPRVFLTLFVLVLVAMVAPNTAYRIDTENRRLVFGSVLFGWRMPALRRAIEVDGSAELVVYVVADLADGGFSHRLFLESEDRRRFLESWESMPNEKADEMVESLGAALGKVLGIKFAGYRPRPRNSWWW
jgi:hypothetical protein